jgi:thiol-disulfide isomerase/thioredoxin
MDVSDTFSGSDQPAKKYARLLDLPSLILIVTILVALFFLVTYARLNGSLRLENKRLKENAAKILQPEVGDAVPPFESTDIDGKPAGISYKSPRKHLLLIFTSYCGACVEELPTWDRLAAQVSGKGLEVRAISLDSIAETKASVAGKFQHLNTILAPDKNFMRTYRVYGFPQVILVSDQGVVEWVHIGKLSEEQLKELGAKLPRRGTSVE